MVDLAAARLLVLPLLACACAALPAGGGSDEGPAAETAPRTAADRRILDAAAAIERDIAAERQRPFTRPVAKQVYTQEQLRQFVAAELAKPEAQREIAREQAFLRAIGFLPPEVDLAELYQQLFASQIAGFYDPADRTLRCISTEIALVQRITMVHEIYHALQDQYVELEAFMEGAGELDLRTDRARSRQAVVEGDAQFFTMEIHLPRHRESVTEDLTGQSPGALVGFGLGQVLASAAIPPYFVETLSWPYLSGAGFIRALHSAGGWPAVDAAFERPPESTEQVLHPRKYLQGDDPPRSVEAPIPAFAHGWEEVQRDTLGEASIAALLRHMGHDPVHAARGSEGWGGDEALLLKAPAGSHLLIWKIEWDSERDAVQFAAAWRRVLMKQLEAGEDDDAPALVAEVAEGGGRFSVAARDAPPLPARWTGGFELPAGAAACVGERPGAPPTWLLLRGRQIVLLRGAVLEVLEPTQLAALAAELLP